MAGQKIVAVFLIMCLFLAAVHVIEAEDAIQNDYKKCLEDCEDKCNKDNKGYTFCEMKCDSDCGAQEFKGTFMNIFMKCDDYCVTFNYIKI